MQSTSMMTSSSLLVSAPQLRVPASHCQVPSRASVRIAASARVVEDKSVQSRRMTVGLLVALPALFSAKSSSAEGAQSAKGASEERKAELRQTAQQIKSSGKDQEAFPEAGFANQEATTAGGKSMGSGPKPRQEDSIQPATPFSAP